MLVGRQAVASQPAVTSRAELLWLSPMESQRMVDEGPGSPRRAARWPPDGSGLWL